MADVVLQTRAGEVCRIKCGPALQEFAMRWHYIVRERHRWIDDPTALDRQSDRVRRGLKTLGVQNKHLQRISGLVQISVPGSAKDRYWESRILPWEHVLATATKPFRKDANLLVMRHLRTGRKPRKRKPASLAIIESAPGKLSGARDFSAERRFVTSSLCELESSQHTPRVFCNPSFDQLATGLAHQSPDVIHLSGIDCRTGRRLMGGDTEGARDGVYLADESGEAKEYRAEDISELLNAGAVNPLVVGFNCWDSGARLAPMTVSAGASYAVGIQHTFDQAVAEIFFQQFYRLAVESNWNTLAAFDGAFDAVRPMRERIRGSSLILWSADSLMTTTVLQSLDAFRQMKRMPKAPADVSRIKSEADPTVHRIDDLLQVSIQPKLTLNYSSLHNGENVFDQMTFRLNPERFSESSSSSSGKLTSLRDVEIRAELHVGAETFPFRSRLNLSASQLRYDLTLNRAERFRGGSGNSTAQTPAIHLPLTAKLFGTIKERIQTSLLVDVTWHQQVLYRQTHPIWLSPADQWTLSDDQLGWLPSFVQPRDPAIARTIHRSGHYLGCLADRPDAGFDGYQSFDSNHPQQDQWEGVDLQVRSIWSTLLFDEDLRYINPPPSYVDFTQRLRSPSETLDGGCGTCVDLAILVAACLEWVEIHPVLFLLHGHVFVGYWKDLVAYHQFQDVLADGLRKDEHSGPRHSGLDLSDYRWTPRWVSDGNAYAEIKSYVDRGKLIPLETVALTRGQGFRKAIDAGRKHFYKHRSRNFRAMIDLVSARKEDSVTPIPFVM